MKNLAHFVIEQLTEKLTSREMLEDTTQFLLEKYEELMFLYTITESISPDREYRKTLSVIGQRTSETFRQVRVFRPGCDGRCQGIGCP
jgi:hypothetical protein